MSTPSQPQKKKKRPFPKLPPIPMAVVPIRSLKEINQVVEMDKDLTDHEVRFLERYFVYLRSIDLDDDDRDIDFGRIQVEAIVNAARDVGYHADTKVLEALGRRILLKWEKSTEVADVMAAVGLDKHTIAMMARDIILSRKEKGRAIALGHVLRSLGIQGEDDKSRGVKIVQVFTDDSGDKKGKTKVGQEITISGDLMAICPLCQEDLFTGKPCSEAHKLMQAELHKKKLIIKC